LTKVSMFLYPVREIIDNELKVSETWDHYSFNWIYKIFTYDGYEKDFFFFFLYYAYRVFTSHTV